MLGARSHPIRRNAPAPTTRPTRSEERRTSEDLEGEKRAELTQVARRSRAGEGSENSAESAGTPQKYEASLKDQTSRTAKNEKMYKRVVLRRMYAKKKELILKKCKVAGQPSGPPQPSSVDTENKKDDNKKCPLGGSLKGVKKRNGSRRFVAFLADLAENGTGALTSAPQSS